MHVYTHNITQNIIYTIPYTILYYIIHIVLYLIEGLEKTINHRLGQTLYIQQYHNIQYHNIQYHNCVVKLKTYITITYNTPIHHIINNLLLLYISYKYLISKGHNSDLPVF